MRMFIFLVQCELFNLFINVLLFNLFVCLSFFQNVTVKICDHILIWVEEQTYWIAARFLTLGFELELYSPSDYCMVYWYIYVILIKLAEKTHIKTMRSNDNGECAAPLASLFSS